MPTHENNRLFISGLEYLKMMFILGFKDDGSRPSSDSFVFYEDGSGKYTGSRHMAWHAKDALEALFQEYNFDNTEIYHHEASIIVENISQSVATKIKKTLSQEVFLFDLSNDQAQKLLVKSLSTTITTQLIIETLTAWNIHPLYIDTQDNKHVLTVKLSSLKEIRDIIKQFESGLLSTHNPSPFTTELNQQHTHPDKNTYRPDNAQHQSTENNNTNYTMATSAISQSDKNIVNSSTSAAASPSCIRTIIRPIDAVKIYFEVGNKFGFASNQYDLLSNLENSNTPTLLMQAIKYLYPDMALRFTHKSLTPTDDAPNIIQFNGYYGYLITSLNEESIKSVRDLKQKNTIDISMTVSQAKALINKHYQCANLELITDKQIKHALKLAGLNIEQISEISYDRDTWLFTIKIKETDQQVLASINQIRELLLPVLTDASLDRAQEDHPQQDISTSTAQQASTAATAVQASTQPYPMHPNIFKLFTQPPCVTRVYLRCDLAGRPISNIEALNNTVKIITPDWVKQALEKLSPKLSGYSYQLPNGSIHEVSQPMTLKELYYLTRRDKSNTTGVISMTDYPGLTRETVLTLKDLIRQCIIIGNTSAIKYGGYPNQSANPVTESQHNIILIDQAGLQFQQAYNSGRLVLVGIDEPLQHGELDDDIYQAVVGYPKPTSSDATADEARFVKMPSQKFSNGKAIYFDINAYIKFIGQDAFLAASATQYMQSDQPICLKLAQAGTGFFAGEFQDIARQHILDGFFDGLSSYLTSHGKGKIGMIEFPFAPNNKEQRSKLQALCKEHSIQCTFTKDDILKPREGYMVALTNCADPHAPTGNEMGYQSVDAAIATNLEHQARDFSPVTNPVMQSHYLNMNDHSLAQDNADDHNNHENCALSQQVKSFY